MRVNLRKNSIAITPVFSAIMVTLVVTATVGSVLVVSQPYIETLDSERERENAEMQISAVADAFKGIAGGGTFPIDSGDGGSFSVDVEGDKTVLMYSLNPDYDFTVSGLDDGDKSFVLHMLGDLKVCGGAESYWFDFGEETCFLAGTKVVMADGSYKEIEDVVVGDLVKSYDEETRMVVDCRVVGTFHHSAEEMAEYYLVINSRLSVTPNHRFYSDGDWVFAGLLGVGDVLFSLEQSEEYTVYSLERVYERVPSFDLEVEFCHTYFVSVEGGVDVLVHNGGGTMGDPVANNDFYSCERGGVLNVTVPGILGNDFDPEGDPLFPMMDGGPYHASYFFMYEDGSFDYEHNGDGETTDYFTYRVRDPLNHLSNIATVTISIFPNPIPEANDDYYVTSVNTILSVSAPGVLSNDTDDDPLTAVLETDVSHGVLTWNPDDDGSFDYTPENDFVGTDQFQYRAYDDTDYSTPATVTITVNDPPSKPSISGPELLSVGETGWFNATATDPNGDQIRYMWDWGDGTYSQWLGPYESGVTCEVFPSWSGSGTYNVKVKAKDTYMESEWSDVLTVKVGPVLAVSPTRISFVQRSDQLQTLEGSFLVWNDGKDNLGFTISTLEAYWCTVGIAPQYGGSSGPDDKVEINVIVDPEAIEPGTYTCDIRVDDDATSVYKIVTIVLTAIEPPHAEYSEYCVADVTDIGGNKYSISVPGSVDRSFIATAGPVVIDLHDDTGTVFGVIWVFDSNSITIGDTILENGGVICSSSDNSLVKSGPSVYQKGNVLSLSIVQTKVKSSSLSDVSGGGKFKVNAKFEGSAMRRVESQGGRVYGLRLQFYGDNKDAWVDFYKNHKFQVQGSEPETRTLRYVDDGVQLMLWHSFITFSIEK